MRAIHLDVDVKKHKTIMIEQWKGDEIYFISYWNIKVGADSKTIAIFKIKYKNNEKNTNNENR